MCNYTNCIWYGCANLCMSVLIVSVSAYVCVCLCVYKCVCVGVYELVAGDRCVRMWSVCVCAYIELGWLW